MGLSGILIGPILAVGCCGSMLQDQTAVEWTVKAGDAGWTRHFPDSWV